ncbi:tetratricopeptide repeat protein [Halomonas binhaiensis]|uniref:Sel1 repeat family protein n=1 Tax=Halomonas binhaiensis TaxID=2562282 RepID=A0A5C1NH76_9GAMM|nr:tetratricopeptide repeat protein [Halomonas binhaiensis]QEM81535.1 sel1 repeat family protein [Halomonas binhaiensis]
MYSSGRVDEKLIFRCFTVLSLSVFISLSVYAEVLYENPVENELGRELLNTTFEELLEEAEKDIDDECVIKSQYLLGVVFLNGDDDWGVDRDPHKAGEYLIKSWENGGVDAGYLLAKMYYQGIGFDEDNKEALRYLADSAEIGFLRSQRALGRAYLGYYDDWKGLVQQNTEKAILWLEKAASAGDLKSARELAQVYYSGDLLPQNYETAFDWLKKSSESKYGVDPMAFGSLAMFYEKGIGTEKDLVQAYKYYDLTSPAGDDDKARVAKEMTQEQIDEAVRQSRAWQEEHNILVPSYDGLEYQEDGSFR